VVDPSIQAPLVCHRPQAQSQWQLQQPISPLPSHHKPMVVSPTNNAPTTLLRTSLCMFRLCSANRFAPCHSETKVAEANNQRAPRLRRTRSSPHRLSLSWSRRARRAQNAVSRETNGCLCFVSLTHFSSLFTDRGLGSQYMCSRGGLREFHNPMYNHAKN